MVVDTESENALSLIEDQLKIGIKVNLTIEDQSDTKQKWDLAKDKRSDWIRLKKPNGFFLESSECGNDLIIQGMYQFSLLIDFDRNYEIKVENFKLYKCLPKVRLYF